jgi:hypothetical protein
MVSSFARSVSSPRLDETSSHGRDGANGRSAVQQEIRTGRRGRAKHSNFTLC